MSASLAVQTAIRARLVATSAVTALVPSAAIDDANSPPARDVSIVLGEDQEVDEGQSIARDVLRVYSTLHIWKKEPGLAGAKAIAGAIRDSIDEGRLTITGWHCSDCHVASTRFLRDPDGKTAHGIVTIETLVRRDA